MLVPVVGTAAAGVFSEGQSFVSEEITVPSVSRKDIPNSAQYALLVSGESINNKIADGAFAICVPLDQYPGGAQHGDLVHVVRERSGLQEHTIKEIRFTKNGTEVHPTSDHPDHQEVIIINGDLDTVIMVRGVVIGAFMDFQTTKR